MQGSYAHFSIVIFSCKGIIEVIFLKKLRTIVIALVVISILASLGFWQVSRLNEKLAIEDRISSRNISSVIDLNATSALKENDLEFRRINVSGHFLKEGTVYIDNAAYQGEYGFNLYSPFRPEGSKKNILVNRGWVAYAGSRTDLPQIATSTELRQIEGIIRYPSRRPFVPSSVEPLNMEKDNLWIYMDTRKYAEEAPYAIYPFVIYQLDNEGKDLIRDWPAFNPKTAMHKGYAIMWFSLSVIALLIFVYASTRKIEEEHL